MAYETIIYDKANRISKITLNRPEKLNALSSQLRSEIVDAVKDSERDDGINVIVVKGAGRAFSAGYDVGGTNQLMGKEEYMSRRHEQTIRRDIDSMLSEVVDVWNTLWKCRKPIISQVHGYCLAGGTDFVLHTDIIVCTEDAQFGYPAVRAMGSPPTHMWTYLVGPQWAKYILLTGLSVDGKTAERIGLVWKAVPADKLEEEVSRLAETIAKVPYGLLALHKRIVNISLEMMGRSLVQQLAAEGDAIGHLDPTVIEFNEIAATQGIKAAFEWRDSKFNDYRATGSSS